MGKDVRLKSDEAQETLSASTGGTLYLILIQVASRALTFLGNQFLLRFLSPQLLGVAVQLELFSVSVLYFSRESLRVALQRPPEDTADQKGENEVSSRSEATKAQIVVNLSYISLGLGLPLSFGLGYLYLCNANPEALDSPYFTQSLALYGLATIVELFAEPNFMIIQQRMLYKSRARAETLAAIVKCFGACSCAYLLHRFHYQANVLPFAVGQIGYALALWGVFVGVTRPLQRVEGFSFFIKPVESSREFVFARFSRPLLSLSSALYAQSIFKQLLTQGDALILSFLATLSDQGAFALASNYGGLIARLLFQPIEESSRNAFGKLLSKYNKPTGKVGSEGFNVATRHLSDILHLYGIIAIFSCCILDTILPILVRVVVGPSWFTPEISQLLSTYCYYIPFLAYNGILDAFVTSVATPAELSKQSLWMGAFTAAYAGAAYILLRAMELGARGLVLGNIVNMILRIIWSAEFISRYLKRNGCAIDLMDSMPSVWSVPYAIGTAAVLRGFETPTGGWISPAGPSLDLLKLVLTCGAGVLGILIMERQFLIRYISHLLPERLAAKLRTVLFLPPEEGKHSPNGNT